MHHTTSRNPHRRYSTELKGRCEYDGLYIGGLGKSRESAIRKHFLPVTLVRRQQPLLQPSSTHTNAYIHTYCCIQVFISVTRYQQRTRIQDMFR